MKTGYRPLGTMVMIEPLPGADKVGSIYLPGTNRALSSEEGIVRFRGPDVSSTIKQDAVVLWDDAHAWRITDNDTRETFVLVSEHHILMTK